VCHAVHRGGSKLLNEGTTCAYCHSPAAWGGGAVASNLISWYGGNGTTAWGVSSSGGPHASCSSAYCHGGPHGVAASDYAGPASRLLQNSEVSALLLTYATKNGRTEASLNFWTPQTRALATAATCSRPGCHVNSMFGVLSAGTTSTVELGSGTGNFKDVTGHRVIASATTNWNANGTDFPTTKTGLTIAFAGVSYCNSCHDLRDDNNLGRPAFPHALSGVVDSAAGADGTWRPTVWLTAGAYTGATKTAVGPYNDYDAAAPPAGGGAGGGIVDGTCLKCHRSATNGVGITY
jgi:hypothetical protein